MIETEESDLFSSVFCLSKNKKTGKERDCLLDGDAIELGYKCYISTKEKTMKRAFIYFVCLALFVTSLTGCGLKKVTNKPTSNSTTSKVELDKDVKEEEKETEKKEEEEEETPVQEPVQQVPAWKTEYLNFIERNKDEYVEYALVYLDGDNIPELYLSGSCEAAGDAICAYKNNRLIIQQMNRKYGDSYIYKSGLFFNFNGNMGYYTAEVYKLTNNGFSTLFYGTQEERVEELENGEYEIEYDFYVARNLVSEEEFYAAINAVYNMNQARDFYSEIVSYSTIKNQINNAQ